MATNGNGGGSAKDNRKRTLIASLCDEDTTTGLLLAGTGQRQSAASGIDGDSAPSTGGGGGGGGGRSMGRDRSEAEARAGYDTNFLIVTASTKRETIERVFDAFTEEREDIAIVLINQHVADQIRDRVDNYTKAFPALLEVPAKDHPYDPEKDSVMKRVQKLFGDV